MCFSSQVSLKSSNQVIFLSSMSLLNMFNLSSNLLNIWNTVIATVTMIKQYNNTVLLWISFGSLIFFILFIYFFFFWPHCEACEILIPNQGSNPHPPQWKHRVLITGPPGKSLIFLTVMGCIFLLLYLPGNFRLDTRHCILYLFGC